MNRLRFFSACSSLTGSLTGRFYLTLAALILTAVILPPSAQTQISSVKTVFVIVMSDQPWSAIVGNNTSAPYINGTLLPMASSTTSYFSQTKGGIVEANYFWLEAGTDFGIVDNMVPSGLHLSTSNHFVTSLTNAGISWKTYQEGIVGNQCPLTSTGLYDVRYNPFVFFEDVTANSLTCLAHVRPFSELTDDLNSNTVARYNFIKPNRCNSMLRSCNSVQDHIRQGDSWLSQEVPKILNSAAYKNGGALFITWDQSDGDTPVGMIVLSPFAKRGYSNSVHYNHSSTLLTLEEIFGLTAFLGDTGSQTSLDDFFMPATVSNTGITLSWTPSPGALSYKIKRATTNGGPFTTIATGIETPNYTDRGLTSGTTYFYVVTAVNNSGESPPSAQLSVTPIFAPPAPTNLTVKPTP